MMRWRLCRADDPLGELLVDAYAHDLDILRSSSPVPATTPAKFTDEPLVYTAFDGDHFALVPLMRRHVLSHGAVPVNPESVIGYKDAVDAYHDKAGVLRADLAVLDKCDEMWIYTNLPPTVAGIGHLAEGVITELIWFLRKAGVRSKAARVAFIPLDDLGVVGFETRAPRYQLFDYKHLEAELNTEFPELFSLISDIAHEGLPPVALCIHDPLDSKYADWLRVHSHRMSCIPVVPSLAIELGDICERNSFATVLRAWVQLTRIADECWVLPSIDGRGQSQLVNILQAASGHWGKSVYARDWSEFNVPKAKFGSDWPLTRREGRGQPYSH